MKNLVPFSVVTMLAFLFVKDFAKVTRGLFRPSIDSIIFTLTGVLIVSLLFIFFGRRFEKTTNIYIISFFCFFIGYFGFFTVGPNSDGGVNPAVILFFLSYEIGRGAIFIAGIFVLVRLLVDKIRSLIK